MNDLKYLAIVALMSMLSVIFINCAHAEDPQIIPPLHEPSPNGGIVMVIDVDRVQLMGKLFQLRQRLYGLKESSMDLIIAECHANYMPYYISEFYFCSLSNLMAVSRIMSIYDDITERIMDVNEPSDALATEFDFFIDLMGKYKSDDSYGGFDWPAIVHDYKEVYP